MSCRNIVILATLVFSSPLRAEVSQAVLAKANALYYSLTSSNLQDENPLKASIVAAVARNDLKGAAHLTTDKSGARLFYDNVVRNIAVTYNRSEGANPASTGDGSNNYRDNFNANDIVALFIGVVRDKHSYKKFLTGNFFYADTNACSGRANGQNITAAYSEDSNLHFACLDKSSSLRDALKQQSSGSGDVGIFTRRQFAMDFYEAGTNRRPIKAMVELLYLVQLPTIKSFELPDGYVRQDVPRLDPAGSPDAYQTNCRGCHSFIDPLSTAFGLLDFDLENNRILRRSAFPVPYKINEVNSPTYKPTSDAWSLFVTDAQNEVFQFRDVPGNYDGAPISFTTVADGLRLATGQGPKDLARVLAESRGYAKGLVTRIVSYFALKKVWSGPDMSDEDRQRLLSQGGVIERLTDTLVRNENLAEIFEEAAVQYLK